ncbi:MAG: tetratricopeptide repeat protein [Phycisphaerales bacterium]|nr:tetratricopeptide repeat protein [Phycisphaerales bacterium]
MASRFTRLEMTEKARTHVVSGETARTGTPVRTPEHDMLLAVEAYRSGKFEGALQLYTRALQGNRSLIQAWVGQVQMLVELGEYDEARLWSDKALELFKSNGELLAAKARACVRQGDRAAAMAASDESIRSAGSSAMRWQSRGEVLLDRRGERARTCFDKSIAEAQSDWFDRVVIARAYLHYDRAAPAHEFAQAAVRLEPGHHYAWLVLGRCQEALGWLKEAEASYGRSLDLPGEPTEARRAMTDLQSKGRSARLGRRLGGLFRR